MNSNTIVCRYTLFALVSVALNLGVQRLVLSYDDGLVFFGLAICSGTLAGMLVKYMLDKRWIFQDISTGIKGHGKKLSLYTTTGIATTIIFWGTETVFWLAWHTNLMREVGAIVGLSIGYVLKYKLDKRFVFAEEAK